MAKVITFSRTFPSYHPKAGEQTYFVEKFWISLIQEGELSIGRVCELSQETGIGDLDIYSIRRLDLKPKHHTIRVGNRWKVGDKFSPRVWSGKPYNSKQIIIAPDIEIKKVYDFKIEVDADYVCILIDDWPFFEENSKFVVNTGAIEILAENDGLSVQDLKDWFKWGKPLKGQIICWNESVEY